MFRIRQNLVNVIFVLDLSQIRSLSLLSSLSEHFVARGFPVRWGFVPEGEGDSESINALYMVQCSLFYQALRWPDSYTTSTKSMDAIG